MSALVVEDEVLEGMDARNDGAIVIASDSSDDEVLITTSDIVGSTFPLDIFEEGNATPVYSTTVSKASVIANTPVPWKLDSIGRNFRHQVSPSSVTGGLKGGKRYTMVYQIETTNDGTLQVVFIWKIRALPTAA